MKHSKIIAILIIAVLTISVISLTGAADVETLALTEAEADAVYEGLRGAENVGLAIGEYQSDTGTTAQLSEEELQAQIDAYNAQIDQYYALDNPCRQEYKTLNESFLRDTYVDEVSCRVDGGVLDYDVHSLVFDEARTTATVDLTRVAYNKWVNSIDNENFSIICCASVTEETAVMVKEDGVWKLLRYERYDKGDNWWPEEIFYAAPDEPRAYNVQAEEPPEVVEAAELADAKYTSLADALNAAEQIDVEELCPLSAD